MLKISISDYNGAVAPCCDAQDGHAAYHRCDRLFPSAGGAPKRSLL